ncbi:MAG: polysaccharide deacetylase family protein, partial [Prochlorococcaceae cyanobacterium]
DPTRDVCITFDDGFENVLRHAVPILNRRKLPFEIFVIGDKLGAWNRDDTSEPLTRFMTLEGLRDVAGAGGRLQWHTRTHPNLQELTEPEIELELAVPEQLRAEFPDPHFSWFAYPYGMHDQRSVATAQRNFRGAVAVSEGEPGHGWRMNRLTVDRCTSFSESWMPNGVAIVA